MLLSLAAVGWSECSDHVGCKPMLQPELSLLCCTSCCTKLVTFVCVLCPFLGCTATRPCDSWLGKEGDCARSSPPQGVGLSVGQCL